MPELQPRFRDRMHAGTVLGDKLSRYAGQNVVVFGIGPAGVVVAEPVARALGADLDALVARWVTEPGEPDRLTGAVAVLGDDVAIVFEEHPDAAAADPVELARTVRARDLPALGHLEQALRSGRPPEAIAGRLVIIVGDAFTGTAVVRAAVSVVSDHRPARLVVALPAATVVGRGELRRDVDEVICSVMIGPGDAQVPAYREDGPVDPEDARAILNRWNGAPPALVGQNDSASS